MTVTSCIRNSLTIRPVCCAEVYISTPSLVGYIALTLFRECSFEIGRCGDRITEILKGFYQLPECFSEKFVYMESILVSSFGIGKMIGRAEKYNWPVATQERIRDSKIKITILMLMI